MPTRNTRAMTVLCPRQTPKLSRLAASPQVLITAGTRIITCDSRVFHVCCTSLSGVSPVVVRGLNFEQFKTFYRVRHRSDFSPRPATSINRLLLVLNTTSTRTISSASRETTFWRVLAVIKPEGAVWPGLYGQEIVRVLKSYWARGWMWLRH